MSKVLNPKKTKDLRRKLRRNQTDAEKLLWNHLRNRQLGGCKFYRQYGLGKYVVDFFCPAYRLVIELDGGQHNEDEVARLDELRTNTIELLGNKVVRFWNNDVMNNIEGVLEEIESYIKLHLPSSSSEEEERVNESKSWN